MAPSTLLASMKWTGSLKCTRLLQSSVHSARSRKLLLTSGKSSSITNIPGSSPCVTGKTVSTSSKIASAPKACRRGATLMDRALLKRQRSSHLPASAPYCPHHFSMTAGPVRHASVHITFASQFARISLTPSQDHQVSEKPEFALHTLPQLQSSSQALLNENINMPHDAHESTMQKSSHCHVTHNNTQLLPRNCRPPAQPPAPGPNANPARTWA